MIWDIILILIGVVAGYFAGVLAVSDIINPLLLLPTLLFVLLFNFEPIYTIYHTFNLDLPHSITYTFKPFIYILSVIAYIISFIIGVERNAHTPPAMEGGWY